MIFHILAVYSGEIASLSFTYDTETGKETPVHVMYANGHGRFRDHNGDYWPMYSAERETPHD